MHVLQVTLSLVTELSESDTSHPQL